MNDITVRQAVMADLPALALLFGHYRVFQGQASEPEAERRFLQERLDHGESVVFIAMRGEAALGIAQLYPLFSSVSMTRVFILNDLYVLPEGRRHGVASALLRALEQHAVAVGASRITLLVARPNRSAQALYEAREWQVDDAFFMYHCLPASAAPAHGAAP